MTIKSLTIENLRGFAGKHVVEFTDRNVAAFIGVNGSGKSTVLEAVAAGFSNLISFMDKVAGHSDYNYNRNDVNNSADYGGWTIKFDYLDSEDTFEFTHQIHNRAGTYDGASSAFSQKSQDLINRLRTDVVKNAATVPVLAFYHNSDAKYNQNDKLVYSRKITEREQTYDGALKAEINFDLITAFYVHIKNLENNSKVLSGDLTIESSIVKSFTDGTTTFFANLMGTGIGGSILLSTDVFKQVLKYKKGTEVLLLSQLSSGEKAAIGLAMDLTYRCIAANSHLDNPLSSPGIVLIDEIELHLHPRWQANIIKALTTTFPNIQFLITTHAPLVINRLKSEQVFVLKNNEIVPAKRIMETYGMDMNAVISQLMHAPIRPKEVEDEFWKIKKLLDEPTPENLARVKKLLDKLRELIDPNDLELTLLSNILSIEESAVDI